MEKRVYFLKFNKKILKMDLISFGSGLIGIILGILSILALQPFWNSDKASLWLTVIAILFDITSFIFAFLPFFLMYRLIRIKKTLIKQNIVLYRKDQISISLDFISFFLGFIGTACEIISIIVLLPEFNNTVFSYQITIAAVILDVISCITCLITILITINIIKDYQKRGNSII
ncbi:hypothetical protein [Spiroplasma sp. AdecLV25b]|uniref:hypothetical protein n=1 Tax=Spiroplasma sp. AdecLV25b TaxID=3027162 RepID=UPI0027E17958|nr:hypothetical protein [Spiroplasma sp. AdecLV25b]